MPMLTSIHTQTEFTKTVAGFPAVAVQFSTDWSASQNGDFDSMVERYPHVVFMKVDGKEMEDVMLKFEVPSVPYYLLFKNGRLVEKIPGENNPNLLTSFTTHYEQLRQRSTQNESSSYRQEIEGRLTDEIRRKILKFLKENPIAVFMKGTPENPKSNFDRRLINALNADRIQFAHYDVLQNKYLQEGIKEFSRWPVFPQMYVDGYLLGGCSVVLEMRETGELKKILDTYYQKDAPDADTRFKRALLKHPVLLFTKGDPRLHSVNIATSRVINALNDDGIDYEFQDVSEDQQLQNVIKKKANWPVFPQLFVRGQFVGGNDQLLEMKLSGELGEVINFMLEQQ